MKKNTAQLQRISEDEYKAIPKTKISVALNNIRSLNNVGSVFRSADAFTINEIILGGISPCPPHRDIHKTALGAELTVAWQYQENLKQFLSIKKDQGYKLLALEQCFGSELMENVWPKIIEYNCILVIGNEVNGVDNDIIELCDHLIEIPQYGTKHSLNVAVSTGICLNDYTRFYKSQN